MPKVKQIKQVLSWLAPTGAEIFIYAFIAVLTLILSRLNAFKELLNVPDNFAPLNSITTWFNNLLENWLGENAATASTLVFWGVIGTIVYLIFWLAANFKVELGNDLAISHWSHPANSDSKSPLKIFVETTIVRVLAVFLLLVYLSYLLKTAWPKWTATYDDMLANWPQWSYLKPAILSFIVQVITLHGFVILTRFIFLKKRVFFSRDYQDL